MEASKKDYEMLKDFQLNDAPNAVLDALYSTYQSRTSSCCIRFFCCCCVPGAEEFTAGSLRASGEITLADLVEALEKLKVKKEPTQRHRVIQANPQQLLQGEIKKTKALIEGIRKRTQFEGLHEDYIIAITNIQDPIFGIEDTHQQQDGESFDSVDHDF